MKAGILPVAASTMMRPVGVGLTVAGPDRGGRLHDDGRKALTRHHVLDESLGQGF